MGQPRKRSEHEMMLRLLKQFGADKTKVCRAFAKAEREGLVLSHRRVDQKTPEEYAEAVWRDGEYRAWLGKQPASS